MQRAADNKPTQPASAGLLRYRMERQELVSMLKSIGFDVIARDDCKISVEARGGAVTITRNAVEYVVNSGAIGVIFTTIINRGDGVASLVDYNGVMVGKIFKPT